MLIAKVYNPKEGGAILLSRRINPTTKQKNMKINKLLVLAALPMIGLTANAQDKGPQKNDFTVAATVSYNNTVMQNLCRRHSAQLQWFPGSVNQLE